MQKAIVPFQEICTGCRSCELACSIFHFGNVNPKHSRISIFKRGIENDLAVVCNQGMQCNEECIASCPVECIKREDLMVRIVKEDCIGCEACVEACPYNAIKMVQSIAIKCDLCEGDPTCVKFCPLQAIKYEEGPKENYDRVRDMVSKEVD